MQKELQELRAQHEALSMAFTGLVSLISENGDIDFTVILGSMLNGVSEQCEVPELADALREIASSLDG